MAADDAVIAAMHDVDFLEEGNIALVESSVEKQVGAQHAQSSPGPWYTCARFGDSDPVSPLRAQAADGSYHARANRGLLKLYQQFPVRRSALHTELVLVKVRLAPRYPRARSGGEASALMAHPC